MHQEELKDFFISRAGADRAWAQWIAWQLEAEGYSVELQDWHFRPGENFVLKMHDAASRTRHTLALLSPSYLAAAYTAPEWAAALAQDPQGKQRRLIPIRVEPSEPSGLLAAISYIDLLHVDEDEARRRLLDGIKAGELKPLAAPTYPPQARPAALTSTSAMPRFPGVLPPVWNIPSLRNPHFTGRDELLDELHSKLTSGRAALTVLHGLGGIGKTQAAVEYAYRHLDVLDLVWWLPASDRTSLIAAYIALAPHLEIAVARDASPIDTANKVQQALTQRRHWLLVFDDAAEPTVLNGLVPSAGGTTLVTSRNPDWPRAERVEVGVLSRDTAVRFLVGRTGQADERAAGELAHELGDLPLALDQAAAYIETTGTPIGNYLALFRTRRQELWAEEPPPPDHPATIATTWTMAMDKVGKGEPAALALLALIACLAPEGTPLAMIRQSQDRLPEPLGGVVADELRLNRVVTALRRYSLLSRSGDTLMTHPLIQVVTRDRLSPEERLTWLGTAVAVIWTVFGPKPGSTTRLLVDESSFPYVGQAFAVAQHLIPPVADAGMAIAMLDRPMLSPP
jgi:hypothetical protein